MQHINTRRTEVTWGACLRVHQPSKSLVKHASFEAKTRQSRRRHTFKKGLNGTRWHATLRVADPKTYNQILQTHFYRRHASSLRRAGTQRHWRALFCCYTFRCPPKLVGRGHMWTTRGPVLVFMFQVFPLRFLCLHRILLLH